jgi:hypothetical protein
LLEPPGGDLHAGRVDTGERGTGDEPERDDGERVIRERDTGVGHRPGETARGEQPARVDHVGQVQHGADQRAEDETALHGDREPRRLSAGESQLAGDARRGRGCGEPQRHSEELRERHQRHHATGHLAFTMGEIAGRMQL